VASGQTTNGLKYALTPSFSALFRLAGENSAESVFAFQATGGAKNTNNANTEYAMAFPYNTLPGNCCGFFQPSFELASSYRVDAAGLPLYKDNSFRTGANEIKNDEGVASNAAFTPDAGLLDPRLDVTIGRRGIPFLDWGAHKGFDWIRDQTYAGPYSPKKYTYSSAESTSNDGSGWTPGYTAINFMMMRYSDVLLMLAEADIMTGDLEGGRALINQVRTRAANVAGWSKAADGVAYAANYKVGTYDAAFADAADALKALRFERKLELGMEGHRFFDVVRWGTADAELNAYISYDGPKIPAHFIGVQFNVGKDELLPIPQHQIDLQTAAVLTQNPNY
ncbi:MAG: RagB/SusD family nutrient uptake outer membrane protein, partial [Chryseolinea sp.]